MYEKIDMRKGMMSRVQRQVDSIPQKKLEVLDNKKILSKVMNKTEVVPEQLQKVKTRFLIGKRANKW